MKLNAFIESHARSCVVSSQPMQIAFVNELPHQAYLTAATRWQSVNYGPVGLPEKRILIANC